MKSRISLGTENPAYFRRLYQAFRELGRTVFLLQYISDIQLREQITANTNKVGAYNGFSKWVFFGGEGILAVNDPEEQEKRIQYLEALRATGWMNALLARFITLPLVWRFS